MKKLVLLALAAGAMLATPASAQYVQRTIQRPDGSVVTTTNQDDGTYDERRDARDYDNRDRGYDPNDRYDREDRYRDNDDRAYRDRGYDNDNRAYGNRTYERRVYPTRTYRTRTYTRRIVRSPVRRCWITWRHHQRVQTCTTTRRY